VGLALAALVGLAACSGGNPVATMNGAGTETAARAQPDVARDMVDCLADAGIPAEVSDNGVRDGQLRVTIDTEQPYVWSVRPGEQNWSVTGELDQRGMDRMAALMAPYIRAGEDPERDEDAPPRFLIVAEQDLTEPFVACLDQTGYVPPERYQDPAEELRQKRVTLDATMRWLECARENGYPGLADPKPPVADEYATRPAALLPADMTEPALRTLLEACPQFDQAAHEAADAHRNAYFEEHGDEDWTPEKSAALDAEVLELFPGSTDPEIGFDAPGYGGDDSVTPGEGLPAADIARLERLRAIVLEAQAEYHSGDAITMEVPSG
jgi:hypothetical protein